MAHSGVLSTFMSLVAMALLMGPSLVSSTSPGAAHGPMPGLAAWATNAMQLSTNLTAFRVASWADGPSRWGLDQLPSPVVLILSGQGKPARRQVGPAVTMEGLPSAHVSVLQVAANTAAAAAESWLGRPVYRLHVQVTHHLRGQPNRPRTAPWVIWEVSSGRLLLDASLFSSSSAATTPKYSSSMLGTAPGVSWAAQDAQELQQRAAAAAAVTQQLLAHLAQQLSQEPIQALQHLLKAYPKAVTAAVAAAVAAAPPLWFCIACPIVLGLLAPLLINFGLGAIAQEVCDHFSMDQTECFDLWVGVLALGFLLSLLASVPIFQLCRLPECAKRPLKSTAVQL